MTDRLRIFSSVLISSAALASFAKPAFAGDVISFLNSRGAVCTSFFISENPSAAAAGAPAASTDAAQSAKSAPLSGRALRIWSNRIFAAKIGDLDRQRIEAAALLSQAAPQPAPETVAALSRFAQIARRERVESARKVGFPDASPAFGAANRGAIEAIVSDSRFFYPPIAVRIGQGAIDAMLDELAMGDPIKGFDVPTAVAQLLLDERTKLRLSSSQIQIASLVVRLHVFSSALKQAKETLNLFFDRFDEAKSPVSRAALRDEATRAEKALAKGKTVSVRRRESLAAANLLERLDETQSDHGANAWIEIERRFRNQLPEFMNLDRGFVQNVP